MCVALALALAVAGVRGVAAEVFTLGRGDGGELLAGKESMLWKKMSKGARYVVFFIVFHFFHPFVVSN